MLPNATAAWTQIGKKIRASRAQDPQPAVHVLKTDDGSSSLEHHFNGVRSPLKSGVDGVAVRGKTDDMVRPWMDSSKSPSERVALLLPQLSLEEKVNQLLHVWVIRTNIPET